MAKRLAVDKNWCAKCKICRSASGGVISFDAEGYPEEKFYSGALLEAVSIAVSKCPVRVLRLESRSPIQSYLDRDPRLKDLYAKTKTAFDEADLIAHGWDHVYRDIINAVLIGEAEGADMNIVLPAVILHDIGFLYDPDPKVHNVVGAEKCAEWLAGWSQEEMTRIRDCILSHKGRYRGFSSEPATKEARVVCDADLLEKAGYLGLLQGVRTFVEFSRTSDPGLKALYAIAKILSGIADLPFYTEKGRQIAEKRGGYLRTAFCEKALAELEEYL